MNTNIDINGVSRFDNITLDNIYKLLQVNQELNSTDIANFFDKTETSVKNRLARMKKNKQLTYDIIDNKHCNFIINVKRLRENRKQSDAETEKINQEITDYKVKAYVMQVKVTRRLIENSNLKSTDILKAIDLQQKALRYIDNDRAYNIIKEIEGEDFFSNKDSIGVVE